ncbi:MAG: hypothetical protein ACE5LF_08845 [Alphaproteobacteria bacterium]
MDHRRQRTYQLSGWGLFIVSAVFFVAASARAGDVLGLLGAVFFFVACLVFLVPLLVRRTPEKPD